MNTAEQIKLLKNSRLFARFSDQECKSVLSTAKSRSYQSGETIVSEGDVGGVGFYMVMKGRVEVRKGEKVLASMGEGEFFGEMALLLEKDTPRSADVVATDATDCLVISRWDLRSFIKTHPDVAIKMMAVLAQRLSETHKALSE